MNAFAFIFENSLVKLFKMVTESSTLVYYVNTHQHVLATLLQTLAINNLG